MALIPEVVGRREHESGTAMVEMAIVLPLLLVVLFGVIEFSRVFVQRQVVEAAARAGARTASLYRDGCTPAGVRTEVCTIAKAMLNTNPFTEGETPRVAVSDPCSDDPTVLTCVTAGFNAEWGLLPGFVATFRKTPFSIQSTIGMRPEGAFGVPPMGSTPACGAAAATPCL